MVLAAASFIGLWLNFDNSAIALSLIALGGLMLQFGITAYGAATVPLFPVHARATVMGVKGLASRIAGSSAPIFVGFLLAFMTPVTTYAWVAVPIAIGAIGRFYLSRKLGKQTAPKSAAPAAPAAESPSVLEKTPR